jgi:hypothetical protein
MLVCFAADEALSAALLFLFLLLGGWIMMWLGWF